MEQLLQSRDKAQKLQEEIRIYEDRGPGKLKKLDEYKKVCIQSANRWTGKLINLKLCNSKMQVDNIFSVKSFILKFKPDMSSDDFKNSFNVDPELDYIE